MDKEFYIENLENLISEIDKLDYKFSDKAIQQKMEDNLQKAILLLENYSFSVEEDEGSDEDYE